MLDQHGRAQCFDPRTGGFYDMDASLHLDNVFVFIAFLFSQLAYPSKINLSIDSHAPCIYPESQRVELIGTSFHCPKKRHVGEGH